MRIENRGAYQTIRRTFSIYVGILLGMAALLGILHVLFGEVSIDGLRWFNLDKERNIPTWFSGALFFFYGSAAIVAHAWERKINAEWEPVFRLPMLWLGIGLAGLFMSLDEMTILHENILWRQVRQVTGEAGNVWVYVTQWQVLFAPAIALLLGYFILFFSNRFRSSPSARRTAFAGIGLWLVALLLEGVRGTFKQAGAGWYSIEVLIEELLEMAGAIFLLASIVFYTIDIALNLSDERRAELQFASRFLTRRALTSLGAIFMGLGVIAGTVFLFARQQAASGAPIPALQLRAAEEGSVVAALPSSVVTDGLWFDDIQASPRVSEAQGEALAAYVSTSILNPDNLPAVLPGTMRDDTSPRMVFLSISDGASPAVVVRGTGDGMAEAIEQALVQAQGRFASDYAPRWVKVDIVQEIIPLAAADLSQPQPLEYERSLYGLAFDRSLGIAFLPEELIAYSLVDNEQELRLDNMESYLNQRFARAVPLQGLESGQHTLYRFATLSFFSDGEGVVSLYRGHRFFDQPSADELLAAAVSGGRYLTQAVGPDGRFVYIYRPESDETADSYNILRHAGTTYSMLELYEVTGDDELLQATKRAIDHLVESALPCQIGNETFLCIVEDGEVKLGGNALAVIALAKYTEVTGDNQHMPVLVALGGWIQAVQAENGEFLVHKQTYPDGAVDDFVSQYYPGEALLAMTRLYALDSDEVWLDTAEKGARWLITVRDGNLSDAELPHDHWLLYALNELYRERSDVLYLNHALRLAEDTIAPSQNLSPAYPDWLGSYYQPPRSTPTATRSEGLYAGLPAGPRLRFA